LMARWMRDLKAGSNAPMRFVVRIKSPSKYSSSRRNTRGKSLVLRRHWITN
jgi:hypothetical protein